MSTINFPNNSVTADEYAARSGQPMHRTYALLQPIGCPTCCGPVQPTGYADWVRSDGIVITLWRCINSDCREHRYTTTFRLTTEVR